jgi:hypothetical protein
MPERRAVSKQMARRYAKASKKDRGRMLDELCALTGWTRRHAIRALAQALDPAPRPQRTRRARVYGPEVLEPLRLVWAMLNGPAGKRLAEVTEARLFFETLDERMETLRRLLPCPNCGSTDLAVKPVLDVPE